MSVASFYAPERWGSRWGVVDAWHPTPHKGLDIPAPPRAAVPALRSGTIVADSPSSSVGRYIVVRVGSSDFDVYCHVVSRGRRSVKAGETLCEIAGWGDPHGSAWSGPHLHFCRSKTATGWAYWGPENRNPEELIRSVLAGAVGGSALLVTKGQDMIRVRSKSSGIRYVIPELAPPTAIPDAKPGSADYAHAKAYSDAFGVPFKVLESRQVRALLDDNAARRSVFFREQAAAVGVSTERIEAGIAAIRAEVEALKSAEPELSGEQVDAIAGQVRAELADALAESLVDDLDAVVKELRASLPGDVLRALAERLQP